MSAPQHFGLLSGQHSIVLLDVKLDRTSAKIDKDALGRKATMGQGQESVRVAVGDMCKFFVMLSLMSQRLSFRSFQGKALQLTGCGS